MQSLVKHGRCAVGRSVGPRRAAAVCRASAEQKSVFITGGNTGIGYETAKALLKDGYRVTIACRDQLKADTAIARLKDAVPGASVSSLPLDLADLDSVHDCAQRVLDAGEAYDVWINNAGVMACPKMSTKQGFEYQLGVNHLGHFALTTAVMPLLQAANKPVRVINVASAAHQFGKMDFEDLMRDKKYDPWEAYGQSKLANVMFTYEAVRRLGPGSGVTVNALHPGVVKTELGRYMLADKAGDWLFNLAMEGFKLFALEPEQGAATSLHLATSYSVEGVTGKYWVDCRRAVSSSDSYKRDAAARLWEVSQELTERKRPARGSSSSSSSVAAERVAVTASA